MPHHAGHHGVGPEVAGHGLGDILLNDSLLAARQDIGTLDLKHTIIVHALLKEPNIVDFTKILIFHFMQVLLDVCGPN